MDMREGGDASSFRAFLYKERLLKSFQQLVFLHKSQETGVKWCIQKTCLPMRSLRSTIWRRVYQSIGAPDLSNYGWRVYNEAVSIVWMDSPPAPDGILENVECACKSRCSTNRCSCFMGNLSCTLFVNALDVPIQQTLLSQTVNMRIVNQT